MIRLVKDIDRSIKSLYGQFMVDNIVSAKKAKSLSREMSLGHGE